jgi:YcxB-like protein
MSTLIAESPAVATRFMWDRKEHVRLLRQVTRHAKLSALARYSWAYVGGMLVLLVVVSAVTGNWEGMSTTAPWLAIIALWFALFRFGLPYMAARGYPKQHPCVAKPFHVALTDQGVRTTCDHSDVLVKWNGVRRGVETDDFFLFYVTDRCAHYLPKRALDGPAAVERARDFILRHTPLRHAGKR